jgi:hypothetical protein
MPCWFAARTKSLSLITELKGAEPLFFVSGPAAWAGTVNERTLINSNQIRNMIVSVFAASGEIICHRSCDGNDFERELILPKVRGS